MKLLIQQKMQPKMKRIPEGNRGLVDRPEHGCVGIGDEAKGREVDAEEEEG
jgi:hypothetical protein